MRPPRRRALVGSRAKNFPENSRPPAPPLHGQQVDIVKHQLTAVKHRAHPPYVCVIPQPARMNNRVGVFIRKKLSAMRGSRVSNTGLSASNLALSILPSTGRRERMLPEIRHHARQYRQQFTGDQLVKI
ncbi:hypothetical protein KCP75_13630 [Salmonella enterica subsp. enterica]|nr:hypothetical protein KCP75_13630 [Salmonella enterica subsp. enterica]